MMSSSSRRCARRPTASRPRHRVQIRRRRRRLHRPGFRRALSRGAAGLFRLALPLDGVHDFTSGYRAYRVSLLRRASGHYGERLVEEQGFACMVELLLKLRHCRPVVVEVPLVLRYDRKQGASKLRLRRTILQYLRLLLRDRLAPPPFRGL